VYSLLVVFQRRGGSGLAVVIVVAIAAGVVGCGPIDSRLPSDAGVGANAGNTGAGGMRTIDPVHDAGSGGAVDVAWPAVSGCVSGLPPAPRFDSDQVSPIVIGCASTSTVILRASDAAAHGMVFTARLDRPIFGLSLDFDPDLCASDLDGPISLVVSQLAFRPGASFTTAVWVAPVGPPPQPNTAFTLNIKTAALDFTIDPDVVDFGTVSTGVFQTMPITITNAIDGAPLDSVFPSHSGQGPFVIIPAPSSAKPSLQPGESRQLLGAVLNTQATGTFEATFLVSAFPPDTPVDPACGVIRSLTLRAQVVAPGSPP
jgi:hypothetical protein